MRAAICLMATVTTVLFVGCQGTTVADKSKKRGYFGTVETEIIHKSVYVIDRSGSMTDSLHYVKLELKRCIGELGEDTLLHVIFFSSGPPLELPSRRLITATDLNRQLACEFIDGVIAQGETDPSKALERAFAVKPDTIYFLTDDKVSDTIIDLVRRLNADKKVTLHSICFLNPAAKESLKRLAAENGGNCKFVSEADLARMFPP